MKQHEIENIISKLHSSCNEELAYFSTQENMGEPENLYIKANEDGLKLYASELLKAILLKDENNLYFLDKENWEDPNSTLFMDHVEITNQNYAEAQIVPQLREKNISGYLIGFGCVVVVLLLLSAIFIGIGTMVSWL